MIKVTDKLTKVRLKCYRILKKPYDKHDRITYLHRFIRSRASTDRFFDRSPRKVMTATVCDKVF